MREEQGRLIAQYAGPSALGISDFLGYLGGWVFGCFRHFATRGGMSGLALTLSIVWRTVLRTDASIAARAYGLASRKSRGSTVSVPGAPGDVNGYA
jgi:hypothetical protein